METAHLIINPLMRNYAAHRRLKPPRSRNLAGNNTTSVRLNNVVEQRLLRIKSSKVDVERLMNILQADLVHVFDDQGFDLTAYDEHIKFQDPITKYDHISGYLFYIEMLKLVFTSNVHIHWIRQTGSYEVTTRWTVEMTISFLPWKPSLVITGTSVIGINPENGKFCSHVDYWDSLENNDYFSFEGLLDIIKQLHTYNSPGLEAPKYQILKRTTTYEVRKYSPFIRVKTQSGKLAGSTGFNDAAGYKFVKNSRKEKIPMTTPVSTIAFDPKMSKMSTIVLPLEKNRRLPDPSKGDVSLSSIQGGFAAVLKFSGKPTEDIVREKKKLLRSSLLLDGLKPKDGCVPARDNDPLGTKRLMMRNEVLIWLEEYVLD